MSNSYKEPIRIKTREEGEKKVEVWVDKNNNSWDTAKYTYIEAVLVSATLKNCTNCYNCISCKDCHFCIRCYECENCNTCTDCYRLHGKHNCLGEV